jgi:hypothetical protein
VLGAALLVGAVAMVVRYVLDVRSGGNRAGAVRDVAAKPLPTLLIGMVGGVIVGVTSVGSGSLMIVLLLFVYPTLSASRLVGTDLTQAVPLTAAAALGAIIFGSVQFGVTASIVIGSVPAVLVGSLLSSRAPDRYIRPVITFVIFASGLKYIGVGTTALGWILCIVIFGATVGWLGWTRPWRSARPAPPRQPRELVPEALDPPAAPDAPEVLRLDRSFAGNGDGRPATSPDGRPGRGPASRS